MVGVADSNSVEPTTTYDARTLNGSRIFYSSRYKWIGLVLDHP